MDNQLTKPKKFSVIDANELDQRIPKNLMISMNGKPFVLKAGLEWKANQLFGLKKWSLKTEVIEYDRTEKYALVKATVIVGKNYWENFGEASKENVSNPQMHKYMLHMAVTRAEARALRVATACGFTAVEELEEAKVHPSGLTIGDESLREPVVQDNPVQLDKCENCGISVTQRVRSWSLEKYQRVLCYDCQKLDSIPPQEEVELISEVVSQ